MVCMVELNHELRVVDSIIALLVDHSSVSEDVGVAKLINELSSITVDEF